MRISRPAVFWNTTSSRFRKPPARWSGRRNPRKRSAVLPATRFGDYRIVRELGRGGMGVVYLAARDDDRFEKLVAIKVMAGEFLDPSASGRFQEERRILASLDHPGSPGCSTPALGGRASPTSSWSTSRVSRSMRIVRRAALSVRDRLVLFAQVCDAVQYSHERLVVHRDIKARNILVTAEGAPKLLDFGIAKLIEPRGLEHAATRTAFRVLTPREREPGAGTRRAGDRVDRCLFTRRAPLPADDWNESVSRET